MYNFDEEFKYILEESQLDIEALKGTTVMVTGALGMLSACLVDLLIYLNKKNFGIKIILLARSSDRLVSRFGNENEKMKFIVQDIKDKISYSGNVDYIIHAAGNSSPYYISNDPLGIIRANVIGSLNVVEFANSKQTKNILFTSTREVYGKVDDRVTVISEDELGSFDQLEERACYPESKRMAENIFKSASIQYGLNFNIARIAHSYGPGMILSDGRVMADLLGDVMSNNDIILKSDGSAVRSFCYVTDAISALLYILLSKSTCKAFNVANENEDTSIYNLSQLLISLSNNVIGLKRKEPESNNVYCNYKRVKLDTTNLESLGWKPKVALRKGLVNTIKSFNN